MAHHGRKKSRGSLSIFSFDAIRSLSRAGSRQGCRQYNDDDQPKKLDGGVPAWKANPAGGTIPLLRPLSPTPAPSTHQRSNLSHVALAEADEIVHPRKRANSDAQNPRAANLAGRDGRKSRKHRPLSWFPPSKRTSDQTTHLPKESTNSAMGRSIISAPVLTSTTNVKIALSEGVPCGELATSGLAAPYSHPESGQAAESLSGGIAKDQLHSVEEMECPNSETSQPEQRSERVRKMLKGTSRRSASMNALSKVRDALTTRLRQASDPQTYRSVFRKDKFVRLRDDCRPPSPTDDGYAQVKEGQNLGKDKIRGLTGHGQVCGKPVRFLGQDNQDLPREEQKSLLFHAGDAEGHCTNPREHPLDFNFEDLEISFAKAVENLDFRIRRDKSSLTSLSSFFHSTKHTAGPTQTNVPQTHPAQRSGPPTSSSDTSHCPQKLSSQQTSSNLESAQPNMGQCLSRAFRLNAARAKGSPEVHPSPYLTDLPSNVELERTDRAGRAQRVFSRGHCNPLASHPDLTTFADQPTSAEEYAVLSQGRALSRTHINQQEQDFNGPEGAPYSPSIRNFSPCAQDTLPSALESTSLSSCRMLHATTSQTPLLETPTRQSRKGTGGRHVAPRSIQDSPKTLPIEALPNSNEFDINQTPRSKAKAFHLRDLNSQGDSHSTRILKPKDQNLMSGDGFGNHSPVSARSNIVKNGSEMEVENWEHC